MKPSNLNKNTDPLPPMDTNHQIQSVFHRPQRFQPPPLPLLPHHETRRGCSLVLYRSPIPRTHHPRLSPLCG
ncbi:hypothetical protein Lal_00002189 [Lupinus albus]|nr:hypothetical protein Lal_00002189 [Lupinus albus]